jgi:hypothetical protein
VNDEEQPNKILNKEIVLKEVEASPNGIILGLSIDAVVKSFESARYVLEFLSSVDINGKNENSAWISARHENNPISESNRNSILAVNGEFGSGAKFLARINLK